MREMESRDYPIREHMVFQGRWWAIERIGWVVLSLILLAALAGFLGDGRTSERTVGQGPPCNTTAFSVSPKSRVMSCGWKAASARFC